MNEGKTVAQYATADGKWFCLVVHRMPESAIMSDLGPAIAVVPFPLDGDQDTTEARLADAARSMSDFITERPEEFR